MNRIFLTIVTHDHSLMIQAHTQYRNKKSHNIMKMPYQKRHTVVLSEHADEIVTKHLQLSVLCYGSSIIKLMCVRMRNCGETSLFEGVYVTNWELSQH